jgi:hypothetical protein
MLIHQIVMLGYKQVSVLHNADMLLISQNGVAEKLHLKNKRPFLHYHTYLFYQQPGISNWFQSILTLSF